MCRRVCSFSTWEVMRRFYFRVRFCCLCEFGRGGRRQWGVWCTCNHAWFCEHQNVQRRERELLVQFLEEWVPTSPREWKRGEGEEEEGGSNRKSPLKANQERSRSGDRATSVNDRPTRLNLAPNGSGLVGSRLRASICQKKPKKLSIRIGGIGAS